MSPEVVAYLERLVAAGHNALYRARSRGRLPIAPYVLRDFPAAVVESWRYVLVACLLFTIPAAVGYAVLRERPELAEEIAPPVMVSRAEQAAERQARGVGYAQAENEDRPVLASWIISNNIMVCLAALAGGLVVGVLTVLSLVYNGLSLGVGFGVFANHHAAGYLATFIAGHGVLELTAVFVSGGAGFRLAHQALPVARTALQYGQMPRLFVDTAGFRRRAVPLDHLRDALLKPVGVGREQIVWQAVDLAAVREFALNFEPLPEFVSAPLSDRVEILERESNGIHHFVAAGAGRIGAVLFHALTHRDFKGNRLAVGRNRSRLRPNKRKARRQKHENFEQRKESS